jgi:hypothetical protein
MGLTIVVRAVLQRFSMKKLAGNISIKALAAKKPKKGAMKIQPVFSFFVAFQGFLISEVVTGREIYKNREW